MRRCLATCLDTNAGCLQTQHSRDSRKFLDHQQSFKSAEPLACMAVVCMGNLFSGGASSRLILNCLFFVVFLPAAPLFF